MRDFSRLLNLGAEAQETSPAIEARLEKLEGKLDKILSVIESAAAAPAPTAPVASGPLTEPPWITKGMEYNGIHEDKDEETVLELARLAGVPITSSSTPWCAAFVGGVLAQVGLKGTGTLRSRDYMTWGEECDCEVGAVAVFNSHVGFVVETGDDPKILGGNQSDTVNVSPASWYGKIMAYRYPPGFS